MATILTIFQSLVGGLAAMLVYLGGEKALNGANMCSIESLTEKQMTLALNACKEMERERVRAPATPIDSREAEVQRTLAIARADVSKKSAPGVVGTTNFDLDGVLKAVIDARKQTEKVYGFLERASHCDHVEKGANEALACVRRVHASRKAVFQDICVHNPNYKGTDICEQGFPDLP